MNFLMLNTILSSYENNDNNTLSIILQLFLQVYKKMNKIE